MKEKKVRKKGDRRREGEKEKEIKERKRRGKVPSGGKTGEKGKNFLPLHTFANCATSIYPIKCQN